MVRVSRMLVAASICCLGGAISLPEDEGDALSLLQVATNKRETATVGATFGCENQGNAANKWVCGEWGDPHRFQSWRGGDKDDNTNQMGWHWLARSNDGQMVVQVFLSRAGLNRPVVSAIAGRFGDTTFKILRKGNTVRDFKLIINGELQPDSPTKRFPDGFFVKPRQQSVGASVGGHGGAAQSGSNVAVCMDSADKRFSLRMDAYHWAGPIPGGIPINMELIADDSDIDKAFPSFCTIETPNQPALVPDDDIIVSPEENSELCAIEGLSAAECQDPPVIPPFPPVEQACMDNGIAYADAQAACESERTKGAGMFEGCVEDCCSMGNLEECTVGPEDMDNLLAEEGGNDEGGNDEASAVGDPHISTMSKRTFDLEATAPKKALKTAHKKDVKAGDHVSQPWGMPMPQPTAPPQYSYSYYYY